MGTTSSQQEKKSEAKKQSSTLPSKADELNLEHHDDGHREGGEYKEGDISKDDQEEKERVGKLFFGDARNAFMEGNRFVTRYDTTSK